MAVTAKDIARVAALAKAELSPLLGRKVARSEVSLTNVGDGLSKAMAVRPAEYDLGDELTMVVRGKVAKITAVEVDPDDEDTEVIRLHVVKGASVAVLTDAQAKRMDATLRRADEEWVKAHEEAKGIEKIEGWEDNAGDADPDDPDGPDPDAAADPDDAL